MTSITLSHEQDENGRVIVPVGTTVIITVTVSSNVIPTVLWIFTQLENGTNGSLIMSNITLHQTMATTVLEGELYQVRECLEVTQYQKLTLLAKGILNS